MPTNSGPDTWTLPAEIVHSLRALNRFVFVETRDEFGFLKRWRASLNKRRDGEFRDNHYIFNSEMGGLKKFEDGFRPLHSWPRPKAEHADIRAAMNEALAHDPKDMLDFYIILDGERHIQDQDVHRMILNQSAQLEADPRTVKCFYFVGPKVSIPVKLRAQFDYITMPPLTKEETKEHVQMVLGQLHDFKMEEEGYEFLSGMVPVEIDRAISHALVCGKREDQLKDQTIKARHLKSFREKHDKFLLT